MIRVFDPEDVCIEEYKSWEEAARAFLKMLNELALRQAHPQDVCRSGTDDG